MKTPYDSRHYPPAPRIEVRFGRPGESLVLGPLIALLDTGADITVLPASSVRSLQARAGRRAFLRTAWGDRRQVRIYSLDIGIGSLRLPDVDVAADEEVDEPVLGRNLLNRLVVILDGPALVVEIRQ